jgi:hypothetical protein
MDDIATRDRLPKAHDAERYVLGCLVRFPERADEVLSSGLRTTDFVDRDHQRIFAAFREQFTSGAVDPVLVGRGTNSSGYLFELADDVQTTVHVATEAAKIIDARRKRQLLGYGESLREAALNGQPADDVFRMHAADLDDYQREAAGAKPKYVAISAAELATATYDLSYLIDRILVDRQPCIIGGPKKSLKTSIAVDLALSLATGGFFLGRFPILNRRRVLLCSAESGLATLQETALRMCRAMGCDLPSVDDLLISEALPKLLNASDLADFARFIKDVAPDVAILDPLYRMHSGDGAENVFKMGNPLADLGDLCLSRGATPIVCHHLRTSRANQFAPAELDDLAYAGCAEYFRQWLLLSRRDHYQPGSGSHRLWLTVGGSAGHNSLWAVDVNEGTIDDIGGRRWGVIISKADEARDAEQQRKEQERSERQSSQLECDKRAIVQAAASCTDSRGTKTEIRDRSGVRSQRLNVALADLLQAGELKAVEIVKANNRRYEGFALKVEP